MTNGGHGGRILHTFDEWIVRVNKRLTRLERRTAARPVTTTLARSRVEVDSRPAPPGTVILWPAARIPDGWYPCDGRALDATVHVDLALLLGSTGGQVLLPDATAPNGLVYIIKT